VAVIVTGLVPACSSSRVEKISVTPKPKDVSRPSFVAPKDWKIAVRGAATLLDLLFDGRPEADARISETAGAEGPGNRAAPEFTEGPLIGQMAFNGLRHRIAVRLAGAVNRAATVWNEGSARAVRRDASYRRDGLSARR
jgi:hypothetical protein